MKILKLFGILLLALAVWMGGIEFGGELSDFETGKQTPVTVIQSVVPAAWAGVGRPLTPLSVAGVARRSARRTTRRMEGRD